MLLHLTSRDAAVEQHDPHGMEKRLTMSPGQQLLILNLSREPLAPETLAVKAVRTPSLGDFSPRFVWLLLATCHAHFYFLQARI